MIHDENGNDERNVRAIPLANRKVTFNDVLGMDSLKKIIRLKIIEPFIRPGLFAKFSQKSGGGILLYGPPGCGKTYIAKAIANECQAEFITVGISDVLNMWVGGSETQLAAFFERARSKKPCVLFFDELDALAFSRSKANSDHTRTLVNEFLNQMDGVGTSNDQILILGATNMPWNIDPALKRPGRFSRQIFVPPPDEKTREMMFEAKLKTVPVGPIDYKKLAQQTHLFAAADIDGAIELAKEHVMMEILDSGEDKVVTEASLLNACREMHPSSIDWLVTARNLVKYGGVDRSYNEVEQFLKSVKLL